MTQGNRMYQIFDLRILNAYITVLLRSCGSALLQYFL